MTSQDPAGESGSADSKALEEARARREALGDAADTCEEVLARPSSSPDWTAKVVAAVRQLSIDFGDHVAEVEDDQGLLPQLLGDEPRLAHSIQGMYDEHVDISASLAKIERLVESCGDSCDAASAAKIRYEAVDVLGQISRHRQAGADLVYNAYSVDIGGG